MIKVFPITKSPVTEYLKNNRFYALRNDVTSGLRRYDLDFYGENGDYLGEMMIHPKGYGIEIHKLIFQEKLKPIYREYIRIKNIMADFWSRETIENPELYFESQGNDKFVPISSTTEKVTIDLVNKTQTKQTVERVLESAPRLINDISERFGMKVYELENQPFRYIIKNVTEETKPYKWGKYSKYNVF